MPILVLGDLMTEYFQNPDPATAGSSILTSDSKIKIQLKPGPLRSSSGYIEGSLKARLKEFELLEDEANGLWAIFALATFITFVVIVQKVSRNNGVTLAAPMSMK